MKLIVVIENVGKGFHSDADNGHLVKGKSSTGIATVMMATYPAGGKSDFLTAARNADWRSSNENISAVNRGQTRRGKRAVNSYYRKCKTQVPQLQDHPGVRVRRALYQQVEDRERKNT